ncbi:Os11g0202350 [Oryza sativa Japonica Group]|uniref:Os11g0202350 protein n=2 Tax=Oryza sativa subsp. japonica TaxID=39947 RepID=C7J8S4_ORYSJ|nr:Os11g0202500 [Oryza sativa Japonica Group]BAT13100.1 Os11g0202350 [Oryza sativa Japonica Group]|eukprot:NP_001176413.1 Os11g0202500 [Oryza sativa Japonica Group]
MRSPVADFQRWSHRRASRHVRTASCAGRKESTWWSTSSGRSPMRSPPVEPGDSLGIFRGDIPSNRLRASPRRHPSPPSVARTAQVTVTPGARAVRVRTKLPTSPPAASPRPPDTDQRVERAAPALQGYGYANGAARRWRGEARHERGKRTESSGSEGRKGWDAVLGGEDGEFVVSFYLY